MTIAAVAGDGQATVSWAPPASDGGFAPITSYLVTSSPGGKTTRVAAEHLSAGVTGLTNGTSYTFTVRATNGMGTGPASVASPPVTPSAPAHQGHALDGSTIALWRFDEAASGDALLDETGNSTLTEHGEPAVIAGQVDGARQFSSAPHLGPQHTNRYFDGPLTDDQKAALDAEWTWEQWVFLDSTSEGTFGNSNDPILLLGNISIFIDASTHKLKVDWPTDHEFAPNHVLPADTWLHLAVTVAVNGGDSTKRDLILYVSGAAVASATALRHPSSVGNTWSVGGPLDGEFFPGSLDDCRVSDVCRTAPEILDSYTRGA